MAQLSIFTTDSVQTRTFTTNQTVTVTVQGTDGDEFTSSIDLVFVTPAYKYLGFSGQAGSTQVVKRNRINVNGWY